MANIPLNAGAEQARITQNALTARRQGVFNDEFARQRGTIAAAQSATRGLMDGLSGLSSPGGGNMLEQAMAGAARPAGVSLRAPAQARLGAAADVAARETSMSRNLFELGQRLSRRGKDNAQVMGRAQRGQQLMGAELNEAGYEAQKGMNIAQLLRQLAFGERQAEMGAAISAAEREQVKAREAKEDQARQAILALQQQAEAARTRADEAARAAQLKAIQDLRAQVARQTQAAQPAPRQPLFGGGR